MMKVWLAVTNLLFIILSPAIVPVVLVIEFGRDPKRFAEGMLEESIWRSVFNQL